MFYVTNRSKEEEPATRENLEMYKFPLSDKIDTCADRRRSSRTGSRPSGTRRAFIAEDYRILLDIGDNFGDFVGDATREPRTSAQKIWEDNRERWGSEWIVIANPTYGSFESTPYKNDFKPDGRREAPGQRSALWRLAGAAVRMTQAPTRTRRGGFAPPFPRPPAARRWDDDLPACRGTGVMPCR